MCVFNCSQMPPRFHHQCSNLEKLNGNFMEETSFMAAALVMEDLELFETETAEVSIEGDNDDNLSNLIVVGSDQIYYDVMMIGTMNSVVRTPLVVSGHSLAATSIVLSAQHAQTIEYNLTSLSQVDDSLKNNDSILKINETRYLEAAAATVVSKLHEFYTNAKYFDFIKLLHIHPISTNDCTNFNR